MNWLQELLDMTDEAESPKRFFYWSGLAAISAVMKRKVFLDKFFYKLYPNIYILLIAGSGKRKGLPVKVVEKLVRAVGNTRIIAGINSIQSITQQLSQAYIPGPGIPPITDSAAFLTSDEFSNLIVDDPSAFTVLTQLYDSNYQTDFKKTLKSGSEELKDIYITMLGAMNPTHFNDKIMDRDIKGGFMARTLTIEENKRNTINSLMRKPNKVIDEMVLVEGLHKISKYEGQFIFSEEAIGMYDDWYKDLAEKEFDDKTGTSERVHDHVLKVAMLLCASRYGFPNVSDEDVDAAIQACTSLTIAVSRLTAGAGKSDMSQKNQIVMQKLLSASDYTMERGMLLRKCLGDIEATDLDKIIESWEQGGIVEKVLVKRKISYRLTPFVIEKFFRKKEELEEQKKRQVMYKGQKVERL